MNYLAKYAVEVTLINGAKIYAECNASDQWEADRLAVNALEEKNVQYEYVQTVAIGSARGQERGFKILGTMEGMPNE